MKTKIQEFEGAPPKLYLAIQMLQGAYPKRLPKRDYLPLICVLIEDGLSSKSITKILSIFLGKVETNYLIDVSHRAPNAKITLNDLTRIREKLKPFGYREWSRMK